MSSSNSEFGQACELLEKTCRESLDWLEDNQGLVDSHYRSILRTLKRGAVDARRLARVADRPLSIGIFGPSQVGKSFLSDTIILGSPEKIKQREEAGLAVGKVLFGEGESIRRMSFVEEINPQGGQETTGLVTRFTKYPIVTRPGYPVALRLFSELDLVKVFANTFTFDLSGKSKTDLSADYLNKKLDEYSSKIQADNVDAVSSEDVYELEDYFAKSLNRRHPIARIPELYDRFWSVAERIIPKLGPNDRAHFLSLLWGEVDGFTEIYLELKGALDQLGHPKEAFAPLSAIETRTPENTILHVLTMKHGLDPGNSVNTTAELMTPDGKVVTLRMSVVTALVSELTLQLEAPGWDFFQTADLLDFPGARSRADKEPDSYFSDTQLEYPFGEAVLRGKIAVLFDKYSSDFDLNAMVACQKADNLEVSAYPELVDEWVRRSLGQEPEDRVGKPVTLFMAITKSDSLFNISAGMTNRTEALENQLSVLKEFNNATEQWVPNQTFNNTYLIRNPNGAKLVELYDYHYLNEDKTLWQELGYLDSGEKSLSNAKSAFLGTNIARKYFDNAEEIWDSMTKPADGGATLLAERLVTACDPQLKWSQMAIVLRQIVDSMQAALSEYFESGDIEQRVKDRLEAVAQPVSVMKSRRALLPRLISEYQVSADHIRFAYSQYWATQQRGGVDGGMGDSGFVDHVFEVWSDVIARRRSDTDVLRAYNLTSSDFQTIASEIDRGARLAGLHEALENVIEQIEGFNDTTERRAGRVGRAVSLMINEFVSQLGCSGSNKLAFGGDSSVTPLSVKGNLGAGGLPEFNESIRVVRRERNALLDQWFDAIEQLTKFNASSAEGSMVNIEQNARLGRVLDNIQVVQQAVDGY